MYSRPPYRCKSASSMRRKFRADDSMECGGGGSSGGGANGSASPAGGSVTGGAAGSSKRPSRRPERSVSARWNNRRARLKRHVSDLSW